MDEFGTWSQRSSSLRLSEAPSDADVPFLTALTTSRPSLSLSSPALASPTLPPPPSLSSASNFLPHRTLFASSQSHRSSLTPLLYLTVTTPSPTTPTSKLRNSSGCTRRRFRRPFPRRCVTFLSPTIRQLLTLFVVQTIELELYALISPFQTLLHLQPKLDTAFRVAYVSPFHPFLDRTDLPLLPPDTVSGCSCCSLSLSSTPSLPRGTSCRSVRLILVFFASFLAVLISFPPRMQPSSSAIGKEIRSISGFSDSQRISTFKTRSRSSRDSDPAVRLRRAYTDMILGSVTIFVGCLIYFAECLSLVINGLAGSNKPGWFVLFLRPSSPPSSLTDSSFAGTPSPF